MNDQNKYRVYIIAVVIFLIGSTFLTRLFFLQIESKEYKLKAAKITTVRKITYPYRGVVFDRYGKLLKNYQEITW